MTQVDKYLDGKVLLKQPSKGYRAGIDAVLLAVSAHPKKGQRVLDVGTGVGAVMMCTAYYHPEATYVGLELQPEIAKLAQHNIELNQRTNIMQVLTGSIFDPPTEIQSNSFDHVITNPPYFDFGEKALNVDEKKSLSRHVGGTDLEGWLDCCTRMLKPRGYLSMIHRADQLDEIMRCLRKKMGGIKIFPLWPATGEPAKLVIIQARKAVKTECQLLAGLLLHEENKAYTERADLIFRGKAVLTF